MTLITAFHSVAAALLSLTLSALGWAVRPHTARCPVGYDLRTGIRVSGRFECWPNVIGSMEYDGTWQRPERGMQPDGVIAGRIWCSGGGVPVVVDERTVGCRVDVAVRR